MPKKHDITIIGGSFSGMAAALALSNVSADLDIAVVERIDIINQNRKSDGRAYAISAASIKFFEEINIATAALKEAGKIADIRITDYKSPFILDFLSQEASDDDNFGYIIESYIVHNALRDELLKRENITLYCPHSYEKIEFEKGAKVTLDDSQEIESELVLACDGRFSKLREIFDIKTLQKKYQQTAIVFNISHEKPHENIAFERFLPGGPLAILPMADPHQSSIVWISPHETAQAILELDEENFTRQLHKKTQDCLGEVKVISKKFSYPLILVEADKFYHEKLLLVGDAAVGVHPIAGQGFNLAIVGIKVLANLVKDNLDDLSSDELIQNYNNLTRKQTKKMIIATDILNSLFETKSLSVSVVRDLGLGIVNKVPKLKRFFIKAAGGV